MEIYQNLSLEDLPNETWRDIPSYEGIYQVSNLGRVKSLARVLNRGRGKYLRPPIVMTPPINGHGYQQVTLYDKNGKGKILGVHQLVALCFLDNPQNYGDIDHINTIKTDNRKENLRWCTRKMNMNNPITKSMLDSKRLSYCHEDWYIEKQRNSQPHSKKIAQKSISGEILKVWNTISDAARFMGVSTQAISRCCNGIVNTSCGYIWEFIQ